MSASCESLENRLRVRATKVYEKIKSANRAKRDAYKTQYSVVSVYKNEVLQPQEKLEEEMKEQLSQQNERKQPIIRAHVLRLFFIGP